MRRLLTVVISLLAVWIGLVHPSSATNSSTLSPVAYGYDSHHTSAQLDSNATERGPPSTYDHATTYTADDRWSHGASARPSGGVVEPATTYTTLAESAQVATGTGTTRESVDAGVGSAVVDRAGVAANGATRLQVQIGTKIEKQMGKRGWTRDSVEDLINNPARTVRTRDTRHLPGGGRNDAPATAYINRGGGYVVRNDETGDIVQVSNLNDPNWKSPW